MMQPKSFLGQVCANLGIPEFSEKTYSILCERQYGRQLTQPHAASREQLNRHFGGIGVGLE